MPSPSSCSWSSTSREREGSKLEFYYNEFVKRDWYKDKNLYDNRGRRIHYNEDGCKVENIT